MSEPVYLSHVTIEPYGGPMRRAYLSSHKGPVLFGVHAEIAEHYGIDKDAYPPDYYDYRYLIAAAAG